MYVVVRRIVSNESGVMRTTESAGTASRPVCPESNTGGIVESGMPRTVLCTDRHGSPRSCRRLRGIDHGEGPQPVVERGARGHTGAHGPHERVQRRGKRRIVHGRPTLADRGWNLAELTDQTPQRHTE